MRDEEEEKKAQVRLFCEQPWNGELKREMGEIGKEGLRNVR